MNIIANRINSKLRLTTKYTQKNNKAIILKLLFWSLLFNYVAYFLSKKSDSALQNENYNSLDFFLMVNTIITLASLDINFLSVPNFLLINLLANSQFGISEATQLWPKVFTENTYGIPNYYDNNFIIGSTGNLEANQSNILIIKTTDSGQAIWAKTYGTEELEYGSVVKASNSDIVLIGFNSIDMLVASINQIGELNWAKLIGNYPNDLVTSVFKINSGYLIAGSTSYNGSSYIGFSCALSLDGSIIWSNVYEIPDPRFPSYIGPIFTVTESHDGNYLFMATRELIKTSANGNLEWCKQIGLGEDYYPNLFSIGIGSDAMITNGADGYILSGSSTYQFSATILELDSFGVPQWIKAFYGSGLDAFSFIIKTTDDGYIATGYTTSFGEGNFDALIIKTNAVGALSWCMVIGTINNEFGWSISHLINDQYLAIITTQADGTVTLVLDNDGIVSNNSPLSTSDCTNSISQEDLSGSSYTYEDCVAFENNFMVTDVTDQLIVTDIALDGGSVPTVQPTVSNHPTFSPSVLSSNRPTSVTQTTDQPTTYPSILNTPYTTVMPTANITNSSMTPSIQPTAIANTTDDDNTDNKKRENSNSNENRLDQTIIIFIIVGLGICSLGCCTVVICAYITKQDKKQILPQDIEMNSREFCELNSTIASKPNRYVGNNSVLFSASESNHVNEGEVANSKMLVF